MILLRVTTVAATIAAAETSASAQVALTFHCPGLANVETRVGTSLITTSSEFFVVIPDTTISFVQHGTSPGCAIVSYSADAFGGSQFGKNPTVVRPILDSSPSAVPNPATLTEDDDEDADGLSFRAHSIDFVFSDVEPGTHTISMQWKRTQDNNASAFISQRARTITVTHR